MNNIINESIKMISGMKVKSTTNLIVSVIKLRERKHFSQLVAEF